MNTAKETYIQLASCDALARLCSPSSKLNEAEVKQAFDVYFDKQEHFFLTDFFQKNFGTGNSCDSGNLIQVIIIIIIIVKIWEIFIIIKSIQYIIMQITKKIQLELYKQ